MKWLRLILAVYATLLLAGLVGLSALGVRDSLALQWTVLEAAIGIALGFLILAASGEGAKPRRLGQRPR